MLKIRLQRIGRKNEPTFRLVLTESKNSTKSGKSLEVLGSHDFRGGETLIKKERVLHWISMGAQVSDTAHNLLISHKIISAKKRNVLPKKTVAKVEEVPEAAAPAPAAAPKVEAAPVETPAEAPVAEAAPVEEAPAA